MKSLRNGLAILFAAAFMVAIMAVPAFATSGNATYYTGTDGYYVQNDSNSDVEGKVIVKVNIHSQLNGTDSVDLHRSVSFGNENTAARTIYVSKVLKTLMDGVSGLKFQKYGGTDITATSASFYQVKYNNVIYAPTSRYAKDGWMFTINKKFPLDSGTPGNDAWGEAINTAYVKDGDVIDVFWNKADSQTDCAVFDRITSASYSSGVTTVQVDKSRNWYGAAPSYTWNIDSFSGLDSATVAIYTSSGTYLASATTNSSGTATINYTLSAGTYVIGVAETWNGSYTGIIHTQETFKVQ